MYNDLIYDNKTKKVSNIQMNEFEISVHNNNNNNNNNNNETIKWQKEMNRLNSIVSDEIEGLLLDVYAKYRFPYRANLTALLQAKATHRANKP